MRTAHVWVITQRVVVISYRLFGTTYRSHLQGSRIQKKGALFWILDPWRWDRWCFFCSWPLKLGPIYFILDAWPLKMGLRGFYFGFLTPEDGTDGFLNLGLWSWDQWVLFWILDPWRWGREVFVLDSWPLKLGPIGCILDSWPLKMGPRCCPETSVINFHYLLCNDPEERSFPVLCEFRT